MAGDDDEEWLTPPEAGKLLHLKPKTLQEYRVTGGGPDYFKAGPGRNARVLYKRSDLKAWLDKFKFQSTSEYKKE
jgi:hypothetical protein